MGGGEASLPGKNMKEFSDLLNATHRVLVRGQIQISGPWELITVGHGIGLVHIDPLVLPGAHIPR